MSTRPYVVRQGDYLTAIAHRLGFDGEAVWQRSENEELRQRRPNPEMLAPGDVLHVPLEREHHQLDLELEATSRFKAAVPMVKIKIQLRHLGEPLANESYFVEGGRRADRAPKRTGSDGKVEIQVPSHVGEIQIVLPDRHEIYPVTIGHLDPIDEPTGVHARLQNLGYLIPIRHHFSADPVFAERWLGAHDDAAELADAIRRFQRDQHIDETGVADEATRNALRTVHGT
jgi:hypothetical protein